jgi:hypothetical protein
MNPRYALVLLIPVGFACDRTPAERKEAAQEQVVEERADVREEQRELEKAEQELREETQEARFGSPTAPGAVPSAVVGTGLTADTLNEIAGARCAREQSCGNVGADQEYASLDACRAAITKEWAEEVNTYECPGGVVQKELNECLESIKREDCASPFDTLGRVVACRSGDICKAMD